MVDPEIVLEILDRVGSVGLAVGVRVEGGVQTLVGLGVKMQIQGGLEGEEVLLTAVLAVPQVEAEEAV